MSAPRIDDESLAVYAAGGGPGDTQALAVELIRYRALLCPTDGPTLADRLANWNAYGEGDLDAILVDIEAAVNP